MINSETKDQVLTVLCRSVDLEQLQVLDLNQILQVCNLTFDELHAILIQFSRLGFVSELNYRRNSSALYVMVHVDALDYKNRGGFKAQDELLKLSLEKLSLEIDQLSRSYPEKASTFTTIAANIATCLALILPK